MVVVRMDQEIRLADIALMPEYRNAGIGTSLIRELLSEGAAAGKPVRLHVARTNRAQKLYSRLGFAKIGDTGTHFLMEWVTGGSIPGSTGMIETFTEETFLELLNTRFRIHPEGGDALELELVKVTSLSSPNHVQFSIQFHGPEISFCRSGFTGSSTSSLASLICFWFRSARTTTGFSTRPSSIASLSKTIKLRPGSIDVRSASSRNR